jgi:hypothetical protein
MLTGKTWWTQCTFQRGPLLARRTWASLVVLPGLQQRRVSGPESPLRIIQSRLKSDNPWSQSHVQTFNNNLKELGVVESKRKAIRRGFVHELLNAQDTRGWRWRMRRLRRWWRRHIINHLHLGGSTQDMESPPPPIDRNSTHRLGDHPCSYHIQLPSVRYHMAPPVHDTRQRQTGSVSTSETTPTRPDQRSPETYLAKGTQQGRKRSYKMQWSMECNPTTTRTKRAHHTAQPTGDPRYSTVQMGCMCLLTTRNSDTVRYSTNDCGYPTYSFNNTETRPHPYISKQAKQSTTETQDINHSNTYYIPGRQSPKTNDKYIITRII